jgi:acyl carrier protein
MSPSEHEIVAYVRDLFRNDLGIEVDDLDASFFGELGVDSLAFLNVVFSLEKRYGFKFANDAIPDFVTCRALAGAVLERLPAAGR